MEVMESFSFEKEGVPKLAHPTVPALP